MLNYLLILFRVILYCLFWLAFPLLVLLKIISLSYLLFYGIAIVCAIVFPIMSLWDLSVWLFKADWRTTNGEASLWSAIIGIVTVMFGGMTLVSNRFLNEIYNNFYRYLPTPEAFLMFIKNQHRDNAID